MTESGYHSTVWLSGLWIDSRSAPRELAGVEPSISPAARHKQIVALENSGDSGHGPGLVPRKARFSSGPPEGAQVAFSGAGL